MVEINLVGETYTKNENFAKVRAKFEEDENVTITGGVTDLNRGIIQAHCSTISEDRTEAIAMAVSLKSVTKPQQKKLGVADLF